MSEKWIFPCNPKLFDVNKHFLDTNLVVWKNSFSMKVGDTVYIYVSSPMSAILYRCKVVSDTVSNDVLQQNQYAIREKEYYNFFSRRSKYVIMELEMTYPKDLLTLKKLREKGLGQVQIQARANRQLSEFLNTIDNSNKYGRENGGDKNV